MNKPFQRYFFEIGIYRCAEHDYIAEVTKATEEYIQETFIKQGLTRDKAPDTFLNAEQYIWERCGGPWHYNQAIGWLRLYVLGTQIRGDLFFINVNRIHHFHRAKEFRYFGKAFELSFGKDDSSEQILKEVNEALHNLSRERKLRKRHLNLETFHNVGPYIDWRRLIGFED